MRSLICLLLLLLLPLTAAAQVTLSLDNSEYVRGEWVEITLHNGTDQSVTLTSSPWYCVVRNDGPYPGCVGLPVIEELLPGETRVSHHDTGALPDPPGEYSIGAATSGVDPATYTLVCPVANERTRGTTLKATYRVDEGG